MVTRPSARAWSRDLGFFWSDYAHPRSTARDSDENRLSDAAVSRTERSSDQSLSTTLDRKHFRPTDADTKLAATCAAIDFSDAAIPPSKGCTAKPSLILAPRLDLKHPIKTGHLNEVAVQISCEP